MSLVLLGLRAGARFDLAHNLHDDMIMRGIVISNTSDDAVEISLHVVIRSLLVFQMKDNDPTRNRVKTAQLAVVSWLS